MTDKSSESEKVREIVRHIENVQSRCLLLGLRLIENGEVMLGRRLIANGYRHDQSKLLSTIEWQAFGQKDVDKSILAMAVSNHNQTNEHHPEYWPGGIKQMPRIFLAECVCDWAARSSEFGSSLTDWIEKDAKKKFKFSKRDKVYREIKYLVNLLLDKELKPIPPPAGTVS